MLCRAERDETLDPSTVTRRLAMSETRLKPVRAAVTRSPPEERPEECERESAGGSDGEAMYLTMVDDEAETELPR